jgi:hypothetical protein
MFWLGQNVIDFLLSEGDRPAMAFVYGFTP